ncbi:intermembrane lipid transfer protein Vps13 isoform X2 [Phlebotomus argentipes]|uniref:intermembrane lipid transfer protein Vps13 isoform X2 n=1 Tax=Phlebotomus argentipes TaxID=94469 RepID=UPI00289377CC|nr:intermembrane lipid transfer protein Vps13 isoform X2 [Phlebotomus argentipes]
MVFESLVTDLLNRFLGEYVENLDTKQLKIGIWGGDVVLNNLKLKENALEELDLPIQVPYGYLGKLTLKIPWKNLYTAPVEACIEDLYIFAKPTKAVPYNVEKEEKALLEAKKAELKRIQDAKANREAADKLKADKSFTEKLVMQIVNNLQIRISNIHIRYEDHSVGGQRFAFGITLKSFSVNTTDENWSKSYLKEVVSKVFKMAELEGLAVYFNCGSETFDGVDDVGLKEKFQRTIATKAIQPEEFKYIFGPISSNARLKLNMAPEEDKPKFSIPKVEVFLSLQQFTVGISKSQYQNAIELAESLDRSMKGAPFRKFRPFDTPIKGNAKVWWHFAYNCIVETYIQRRKRDWLWENMRDHCVRCREYSDTYKCRKMAKKPDAQTVEKCEKLEEKIDLFNLMRIQEVVDIEVAKIVKVQEPPAKSSWFGSWFGGGAKQEEKEKSSAILNQFNAAMTNEEKAKLYNAIGYSENAMPTELPEDYVAMRLHFEMNTLEVAIMNDQSEKCDSKRSRILMLQLREVHCKIDQRPAASAIKLKMDLKTFSVFGVQQGDATPNIIKSKCEEEGNQLSLDFETNPLDHKCDQRIKLRTKPLKITYDGETILQLLDVFKPPKDMNISQIQDAASDKLSNVKERSATGLEYMIETHTRLDIDIVFMPVYLIVPYKGVYLKDKHSALIVSLGTVTLLSAPRALDTKDVRSMFQSGIKMEDILQEMMEQSYDVFNLKIENLQVLFVEPRDNWRDVLLSGERTDMHFVEPTNLTLSAHSCVIDDDPRLPKIKISGELPYFGVSMSQQRFLDMVDLLMSIPLPQDEETVPKLPEKGSLYQSTASLAAKFLDAEKVRGKKKLEQSGEITEEIQQFTNLIVNFIINEISIVLFENHHESSMSTPSNYETPTADEFTSVLSTPVRSPGEKRKIISFKVMHIGASLLQRTYDMKVNLRLGGIALVHYMYSSNVEREIDVISTPGFINGSEYLLTIDYLNVNKESPEFVTKYSSVEQLIEIKFSMLILLLHQEGIIDFLGLVDELKRKLLAITASKSEAAEELRKVDRIASAGSPLRLESGLPTIFEEEGGKQVEQTKKRRQKVVDSIKVKVVANLESVTVKIESEKRPITTLQIENLSASTIIKSSYTELCVKLKNIAITDKNPASIHTTILSVMGDDAINCRVVLFNLDETSNYNSDDIKIEVSMGGMKVVFLNWYIQSVLNFLDNFQAAQEKIAEAGAAAADAAKQNVVDAYSKATRMNLNVRVKAPIIILPEDSQSVKALCLDLGYLIVTNNCYELPAVNEENTKAVIDDMKLDLKDLKVSKVNLYQDNNFEASHGEISFTSADTEGAILTPATFSLNIIRNLSASWYKEKPEIEISGKMNSIVINLDANDYRLVMDILGKNMQEGELERKAPPSKVEPVSKDVTHEVKVHQELVKTPQPSESCSDQTFDEAKSKITTFLKFAFQMDSLIINLSTDGDKGLASFGIYVLSVKGNKLADGSLNTSVVLCDIQWDDIRPQRENMITRFMGRKTGGDESNEKSMIDITASIKDNSIFAELRIRGFDLIISMDYIMKLMNFLNAPNNSGNEKAAPDPKKLEMQTPKTPKDTQVVPPTPANQNSKITVNFAIEQPDIILVEKMDDINCHALILNCEAGLKFRQHGEKQVIRGDINNFNIHMCEFNPSRRALTRYYVLKPVNISLSGSTPDTEGLHVALTVSSIEICISPGTIQLVNRILVTMNEQEKSAGCQEVAEKNYSDLWDVKNFTESEFWYTQIEEATEAIESPTEDYAPIVNPKNEVCTIEVPSFIIKVESGFGYYTIPMLRIDSNVFMKVCNWSSDLSAEGTLQLGMSYYNSSLALWEPLIEPNERELPNGLIESGSWELQFSAKMCQERQESFDETLEERQPLTKICVNATETLELTVTKTCLEVLQNLGKGFSEAINSQLTSIQQTAPYVIQNDTGFDITFNLQRGGFNLHSSHLPQSLEKNGDDLAVRGIVFHTNNKDESNVSPENVTTCKLSPGACVYLQLKNEMTEDSVDSIIQKEKYLHVRIGDIDKELILPVYKADKRYFPLYRDTNSEPWGIISNIKVEYGSTIVTIHGVVQIHNHFSAVMSLFRRVNGSFHLVGEIPPNKVFNVPLHAIYANNKELHFSLPNYKPSIQGINWKDSPSDFEYRKTLQCDPEVNYEPFYINAVRTRKDVYYEVTSKITMLSVCYIIHLRPPVLLRNTLPIPVIISVAGCSVVRDQAIVVPRDETKEENMSLSVSQKECEDFLDYGEKVVQPGEMIHLPTIQLAAAHGESYSNIVVRISQYLDKDWSCTTEIPANPPEFAVWTFRAFDSAVEMSFELGVHFQNREGSLHLSIYCPFWMVNKTGLMLSYRGVDESINILYHPPEYNGPILFSFREKVFFGKNRASIRIDTGDWSDKFPLDVAGSSGVVQCRAKDTTYQIAVHNALTKYSLTKQITFLPNFILVNKAPVDVEVQEENRPGDHWLRVSSQECIPLWPKVESNPMLRIRVEGIVTPPFRYTEVQCSLLKLQNNKYGGIYVDVSVTEGGTFVQFTEYFPGNAPALIVNHTDAVMSFWEKGNVNERVLKPNEKTLYTWADPASERIIYWNNGAKDKIENDLQRDGVGSFVSSEDSSKVYWWVSFLDGVQRTLLFTKSEAIANETQSDHRMDKINQEIELNIHGIGLSIVNNMKSTDVIYIGIASSGVIWEEWKKSHFKQMKIKFNTLVEEKYQEFLRDQVVGETRKKYFVEGEKTEVNFNEMKIQKSNLRAIRRVFYPGLWFNMKTSPFQTQMHAKINRIQIDNQTPDCIFPVILAPVPPPKSVAATHELKPFVEASIVERVIPFSTVKQFKYWKILMQEFHVRIDLGVINEVFDMITTEDSEEEVVKIFAQELARLKEPLSSFVDVQSSQEQKNFYDQLHLGPLKVHVSFSMSGSDTRNMPGILSTLLQSVGVTLTDVNDVVFRLAFFDREYVFLTQKQLMSECMAHYTGQAVKQLYVLVLGLDVIGNPFGLVVGIKKGVEDLFYEPFQGLIQGPGEFAQGLVLGVRSLFGHTVGGAAGAVSKITGAVGKGLAALTFDKEYQKKRRNQINRKPANLQEGLARSGKGLVMGVVDGVTGVFSKPISGARSDGVEGFFKGLGKGAVGLVTRPTAGVVDFASGSFEAVKRATEMSEDVTRLRPPRFLKADAVVQPYSRRTAEGNKLLKEIDKGKYADTDSFVHSETIIDQKDVFVVSDQRVLYCVRNDLFGGWQIEWTHRWEEISSVQSTPQGVELRLVKEQKKGFSGLFGGSEHHRKILIIPRVARREQLVTIMRDIKEQKK